MPWSNVFTCSKQESSWVFFTYFATLVQAFHLLLGYKSLISDAQRTMGHLAGRGGFLFNNALWLL